MLLNKEYCFMWKIKFQFYLIISEMNNKIEILS